MSLVRSDEIATEKGNWGTPWNLYRHLDAELQFDADVAASSQNAKHPVYFTKSMDSLSFSWKDMIGFEKTEERQHPAFWLNPDYSKGVLDKFMAKARLEASHGALVACLVPVFTDTRWFQEHVFGCDNRVAVEIRFIAGRVNFIGHTKDGKEVKQGPTFPSCIVLFSREHPHYWMGEANPLMPYIGKTIVMKDLK